MNRTAAAILGGVMALACIVDIAAGYLDFGALPVMGTVRRLDPSRSAYLTVTPAGAAAGIRPGDVLDLRVMDVKTRAVAWAQVSGRADETYSVPLLRNGAIVYVPETLVQRPPIFLDLLDVVMRVLLAAAGVFLIARGTAKDSLYAGIFVLSLSIYEGFAVHYWGPSWVSIVMVFASPALAAGVFGARLLFAFELLPAGAPRAVRGALLFVSWAALAAFAACSIGDRPATIFGAQFFTWHQFFITQMTVGYASILVFAAAAAYARGRNAGAVRWIFAAMLISQIGPTCNWVSILMGWPLPASGALGVTYLTLAAVLPYAVLAQGLVAVDFVFSRALVYTIVLAVIVSVFILAEQLVERVALGRVQSAVVDLIVPLALGFSVKWIEAWAERLVERVLYRDKMHAADEIDALIDDFPHARNIRAVVGRVANEVHRLMRSPFVCVYREAGSTYSPIAQAGRGDALPVDADDPVFLRLRSKHAALRTDDFGGALPGHGAVFPLLVFGSLTGALYVAYRESGEQLDPDEIKTLERLAHELAIALLWIERTPQIATSKLGASTS